MSSSHRQQAAGACLDLRHLPAPEPFVQALAAVDASATGSCLELLTPMLPLPLLRLLAERGLEVEAESLEDGSARVRVRC